MPLFSPPLAKWREPLAFAKHRAAASRIHYPFWHLLLFGFSCTGILILAAIFKTYIAGIPILGDLPVFLSIWIGGGAFLAGTMFTLGNIPIRRLVTIHQKSLRCEKICIWWNDALGYAWRNDQSHLVLQLHTKNRPPREFGVPLEEQHKIESALAHLDLPQRKPIAIDPPKPSRLVLRFTLWNTVFWAGVLVWFAVVATASLSAINQLVAEGDARIAIINSITPDIAAAGLSSAQIKLLKREMIRASGLSIPESFLESAMTLTLLGLVAWGLLLYSFGAGRKFTLHQLVNDRFSLTSLLLAFVAILIIVGLEQSWEANYESSKSQAIASLQESFSKPPLLPSQIAPILAANPTSLVRFARIGVSLHSVLILLMWISACRLTAKGNLAREAVT